MKYSDTFKECQQLAKVFLEQVYLLILKHLSQKQRNGRLFLKNSCMVQFFVLSFITFLLYFASQLFQSADVYSLVPLPPLSNEKPWGIFNPQSNGNTNMDILSKRLYFAPNNHEGIMNLTYSLNELYPDIEMIGVLTLEDAFNLYEQNIFNTWAVLDFNLSSEQAMTGKLVLENQQSYIDYTIYINPMNWGNGLPTNNITTIESVYNKQSTDADLFWSTGYMTLQNFIANYLTQEIDPQFKIETFVQRYPKSPLYPDEQDFTISGSRNSNWKWIGSTILAVCIFIPSLSYLTEIVREKQYKMKDLLEISGMMDLSYWVSYLIVIFMNGQFSMWVSILLLLMYDVFDSTRIQPYAALLTCYMLGSTTFSFSFGFLIPRSEYYGLPIFILTIVFTIVGAFMAINDSIPIAFRLMVTFLSPSIGLTFGVITIENYLYYHNDNMNYSFINYNHFYPSLNDINGCLIGSALLYFIITLLLSNSQVVFQMNSNMDNSNQNIKYPCDEEDQEDNNLSSIGLEVSDLGKVYPDGTAAVKGISFKVKKGEILSFLGANGAGKSTTMNMLCGTLGISSGDAFIDGFSILTQKILARRKLGIAMQQDVLWDDINVEDHLRVFGRLRGLNGLNLENSVEEMIQSLGFPEKRKSLAGTLSGGQKRRLCVGLSMVGGNPVVYLDEPTAGLDPVSRRQLWELVLKNRANRSILLTTHFMDEADILGNRIAIVKEGRLRAIGTSKFLKRRFGVGYLLRLSILENASKDKITSLVGKHIQEISQASSAGSELTLRLPKESASDFPAMFEDLELKSKELGISSYGIETTTLEEVFMRIVNEDDEELIRDHDKANLLLTASSAERDSYRLLLSKQDNQTNPLTPKILSSIFTKGINNHQSTINLSRISLQIYVMCIKRFFQFIRSRGQIAMGLFFPIIIAILIGLLIDNAPDSLIGTLKSPVASSYIDYSPTLVASPEESMKEYISMALGGVSTNYVGTNYSSLFNTVSETSSQLFGPTSSNAIYLQSPTNFTVLYNATYPLNFEASVHDLINSAIKNTTNNQLILHQLYNSLPRSLIDKQSNDAFYVALLVSLIAGSFGAGLSIIISGERVLNVKHQQFTSGASSISYWLSNFIFDFAIMFLYILLFGIILIIFKPSNYLQDGYADVIGSGFFFVLASIFRFYSCSYAINDIKLAQSIYFYGSLGSSFILVETWFAILFTTTKANINDPTIVTIGYIFAFVEPNFAWYMIIMMKNNLLGILTQNEGNEFWSYDIAGGYLLMMILSALTYGILFVIFVEKGYQGIYEFIYPSNNELEMKNEEIVSLKHNHFTETVHISQAIKHHSLFPSYTDPPHQSQSPQRSKLFQDKDIQIEKEKVQEIYEQGIIDLSKETILIHGLQKVFYGKGSIPTKVAVKDVSMVVPKGEIFALLGANGAGKTTLLKMISGQELPTSGTAWINGYNVMLQTKQAQESMGLCPQFDSLIDRLTVKENIAYFGTLKGVESSLLSEVTEAFMIALHIKVYENKLIQQLSGGNRRKVSLIIALIGSPPSVYLDEPSTGLDPVASRLMWRLLSAIGANKSSAMILTTHNMIESEAIGTRIGLMKAGELICLGDSQHLRSTYGQGFQLEIHIKTKLTIQSTKTFIESTFPNAFLLQEHDLMLNYEIPTSSIPRLSLAFQSLQTSLKTLQIEEYSFSQSSLEQVFLKQIQSSISTSSYEVHPTASCSSSNIDSKPFTSDYCIGYLMWFFAILLPGLHHFYLGNPWRGLKYALTFNEVLAGWFLDVFELHILIQQSVEKYGHHTFGFSCFCKPSYWFPCCQSISSRSFPSTMENNP